MKINSQMFHLGPCTLHGAMEQVRSLTDYLSDSSYFACPLGIVMVLPRFSLCLETPSKSCFSNVPIEAVCSTVPTDHQIQQLILSTMRNLHISRLCLCISWLIFLFHLFIMCSGD